MKNFFFICVLVATAVVGCAGVEEPSEVFVEVPSDWIGHTLGLSAPRLRPLYKVTKFVEPVEGQVSGMIVDDSQEPSGPDLSSNRLMAMGPDGTVYEVLISPAELAALGDEMERLGRTGASDFTPAPSVEKGWSNGIDNRNRTSTPNPVSPASRIGQLSAGCTGTLFGSRLVLTAFHCLWDGAGNWRSSTFRAGRDGTSVPYGNVSHVWKYWSQGYVDNNCNFHSETYPPVCTRYDWAILVLAHAPTSPTGSTPGYMGYAQNSNDSTVAGWNKYHNGYPGCADPGAPVGCVANTMWGQTGSCANGGFFHPSGDWKLDFYHGCDMSPGHSGGALYSWTPGSNGPYIVGINIAETCEGAACGWTDFTPNIALRLHPAVTNVISYARSVY